MMPHGAAYRRPCMNLLDLLLVVAAAAAVAGGYRVGLLARGASWIGIAAGVVLAAWAVPAVLQVVPAAAAGLRLLVGVGVLVLVVTLLSALGQQAGLRLRRSLPTGSVAAVDQAAGAVAGGLSIVLVVWFLLPAAAEVPGTVSRQVRSSLVVAAVRDVTPPPPDTVRALRALVDQSRFPEVFANLRPAPLAGTPPAGIALDAGVLARATAATVNVESTGCGHRYEGTGVTLAEGLVVTNAHVVAGSEVVRVRRPDGTVLDARVRVFDPGRDLAVLDVPGLGQRPLRLAEPRDDSDAAVIGYPGGRNRPRIAPAGIERQREALGRDIYGRDAVSRDLLFLAAELAQGDSGSPVVDPAGQVVGVVFAIAPDQPTTAYALAPSEVAAVLDADATSGAGPCI